MASWACRSGKGCLVTVRGIKGGKCRDRVTQKLLLSGRCGHVGPTVIGGTGSPCPDPGWCPGEMEAGGPSLGRASASRSPQLFRGWGSCHICWMPTAYCVPWPCLSPDRLGTQGGCSPRPPFQGPGQLGSSGHGEGGDRGSISPGAQFLISLPLPSKVPNSWTSASFSVLGSSWPSCCGSSCPGPASP